MSSTLHQRFISTTDTYRAARLEEVKGYTIAIEATWYLNGLLDTPPVKEPLLSALGGLPYWLSVEIEDDLDQWERHGLTPLFIFDGISIIGKEEMSLRAAKDAARRSDAAWALYRNAVSKEQTTEAVTAFGNSCSSYVCTSLALESRLTSARLCPSGIPVPLFPGDSLRERSKVRNCNT